MIHWCQVRRCPYARAVSDHRSNARKAVGLLVKLSYTGVDEFAQRYATNLSDGGMFIRSRDPKPVGTELKFRVEQTAGCGLGNQQVAIDLNVAGNEQGILDGAVRSVARAARARPRVA
mgnify:CR=1 FL=1